MLGTIAETSREALDEMRRMVLLLRGGGPEPEHAAYVPTPGLTDIPELVRKTSETAQLSTFGPTPRVSQALGLSAYRIVQESLTNVLKHAGPDAVARVSVAYTPDRSNWRSPTTAGERPHRATVSATACKGCGSGSPCTAGP